MNSAIFASFLTTFSRFRLAPAFLYELTKWFESVTMYRAQIVAELVRALELLRHKGNTVTSQQKSPSSAVSIGSVIYCLVRRLFSTSG